MIAKNEAKEKLFITQLQSKSQEAFAALYDNYSAALFGVALKLLQVDTVAEDVLQESFIKIWSNLDKYNPTKGTLFTWMLNITRNCCIDHLRSRQHKQKMQLSENDLEYISNVMVDKQSLFRHERRELHQIAGHLDDKYRELIDLVYFYGYSMEEVSKMLNIPTGTIKTRCRAAIKQLRDIYRYEQIHVNEYQRIHC